MKIGKISAVNFLRLRDFAVDMNDQVVHIFCGRNEAGKTSLQEALRFALCGETPRVTRKTDYPLMVRDGAKDGSVRVETDIGVFQRTVKKGTDESELTGELHWMAPNLLDSTRIAWVNQKDRRKILSELLEISVDRDDVKFRLQHRGLDAEVIEYIMPMLRNGFDSASAECKTRATLLKGEWRAHTLEDWGSKKGRTWIATPKELDTQELVAAQHRLNELSTAIADVEAKLEFARGPYGSGHSFECPSCKARLSMSNGQVEVVQDKANDGNTTEFIELTKKQDKLDKERVEVSATVGKFEELALYNSTQDEISEKAQATHKKITAWLEMASALAPDGIPAEIIASALQPVNAELQATAAATGWDQVVITPLMDVEIGGRVYGLCSESSQWRAQVEITEALSAMSARFFVVDRMDVLDTTNRLAFLKWISSIAHRHDTIIVIGTLKEAPKLPPSFGVHWLEDGEIPRKAA